MRTTISQRLDALYGGRPRIEQLRARGMVVIYGGVTAAIALMFAIDLTGAPTSLWMLALTYSALGLVMLWGLWAVLTGRDELATRVVPVVFVLFSGATVLVALDGNAHRFFSSWSKWYPVFILVNALFLAEVQTVVITAAVVGWTVIYFVVFGPWITDPSLALVGSDLMDGTVVPLITGGLTVALIRFTRGSLAREQEVNAGLEATVAERTGALRAAVQERQAVLEHMADGVLSVGPDGAIRLSNAQVEALFPSVEGEPDPALRALIETVRTTGEPATEQLQLADRRVVKVLANPIPSEQGTGVVALVHDRTLEAEVDRLKTDFISTVSHELRTPLTSILGFSKMIRARLEKRVSGAVDPEDAKANKALTEVLSNLDIVVSEGERLTELINDVLDIAKMEAGRVDWRQEPVDVESLARTASAAVTGLFGPERPVELVVELGDDLGVVLGDQPRLVQVLVNLLSNASKFTREGRVTLRAERRGPVVELSVSDTGPGIPAADFEAIFDRFRQVDAPVLTDKPQGTGLGLPICRQIARAHGSDITVQSTVGEGSRFALELPAVDAAS